MYLQDSAVRDIWGYYDAEENREYAIVGSLGAVSIVEVTDPYNPVYSAFLPGVPGFDVKVWDHYVYAVEGGGFGIGKIIDISDPTNPEEVGTFEDAHNIFIDEQGYLVASRIGTKIYNLNNTPESPQLVFQDSTTFAHDAFILHDMLFSFNGSNGIRIYDVKD
ncbi:MAG: hypothetical protein AAF570_27960, partial [Bacteroidota bacterium]